ncbi:YrdB family protein [Vibrio cholerae]|uniref:Uncharacterized protein n=3 Tax=Vibrio cholerae TaxID=666 RepID=Q9KMF5_VIBCH|nr:YrdB family protein [Vibrio cholerae]EAZ74712.1 hypothetical protein A5C_A0507 [Vibrio cholerae NCTC 8457]AAF96311.1 hypothetical protein VC_A0405 [Vibrio cholerae O1 biovar El Tor str. N16961]ANR89140.1 hypothetical protein BBB50_15825 [Vibrio cholerae 2740-80]APF50788.1 hypothetical protein ASZ80_03292 [Vibrio cholerae]APF54572.1 hypothetical protein ASZ82_03213 [Vibrio cholerae]
MFGGVTIWLALSILIGYWASKLGREGVVWGLIAALISPLLAAICLLIIGDSNEKINSTDASKGINVEPDERDREWEVVKKYVPEVASSLKFILESIGNKGVSSAEYKLKELFFVIGKEGLTRDALDIIIDDVKREIEEQERLVKEKVSKKGEGQVFTNMELINSLKGNVKTGFNSKFSLCEICNVSTTGQTISGHYVCGNCKQSYL